MDRTEAVTRILARVSGGEREAVDELLPIVYGELRALAARYMRGERPDHTLQATGLTHEAYLRLLGETRLESGSRAQFFAIAARAMRQVLVDHARARGRLKRGGGVDFVPLLSDVVESPAGSSPAVDVDLLALDEALTRFAAVDARKAQVVELLYFGGLTSEEAAGILGITSRTVERDWRFARLWLLRELTAQ